MAIDGNEAAANVAYAMSDVSFIYPITPATPMGEHVDSWANEGRVNLLGNTMQVLEMESEAGVAGALHGALSAGALATSFTCSQGLLLMIPNMYKIAGELLPCVLHVSARALAGQALSIFGDHQARDVMAVRQAGWAMLCSHSVQEAQDLALVAHLATLKASVPFVHFFDGFRTSHEICKVSVLDQEAYRPLLAKVQAAIDHHRRAALNPAHPHQRGTSQGPDIYFQMLEAANKYYRAVPGIVQETMDEVAAITGRPHKLFEYVGAADAERVVVAMGSGCKVIEEAVQYLSQRGEKVGVLKVHLFRPWSADHFLAALPASTARVAVLDRTKEAGSMGEPLHLDVAATLGKDAAAGGVLRRVVGGRYGLGSKDFTPAMAKAVYDNLKADKPKDMFTVGITDDVTFTSLPTGPEIDTLPRGTYQCLFWGMGSDGTVGANKEAIKIIAQGDDTFAQAYFSYDAHKSGGVTVSHLRFGPKPITSSYLVAQADYLGIHMQSYLAKYDCLSRLKPGGVLALNAPWRTAADMEAALPARVLRQLASLGPRLYVVDARAVAEAVGLGKRINMVMQTVFFQLSGVVPMEAAVPLLKQSIRKAYGKKGEQVVAQNCAAVDGALAAMVGIDVPAAWAGAIDAPEGRLGYSHTPAAQGAAHFLEDVVKPVLAMRADPAPAVAVCSVFRPGGFLPPGTTAIEQRAIASAVPAWEASKCTQCNICAFVCPHAAIRPVLATPEELAAAPAAFNTLPIKGSKDLAGYQYRVQVSPVDCTGCELCVHVCPDDALKPKAMAEMLAPEAANWDFMKSLPNRGDLFNKDTVRGSQFQQPLMEFSGACEGCGETPYVKLLTQMFGERMVVANATGCSSIWGGSAPSNPYTVNPITGRGPAWANSLFEDNAQFGLGIHMGLKQRRTSYANAAKALLADGSVGSPELHDALGEWLQVREDFPSCCCWCAGALQVLAAAGQDLLEKPSVWIVGGDGWAYDIGFGGLDHVMASGEDVNILVLDTEMYSNTGGQKSKATPLGAVVKFAAGGKARAKKDLAMLAMQTYGQDVYVASVCLEANPGAGVVKAFAEAEAHKGVSLIVAYAPCAMQGISGGMSCSASGARAAVDVGYWPLYRCALGVVLAGHARHHGRLTLDARRTRGRLEDFLQRQNRFSSLTRKDPRAARSCTTSCR
ncbi:pyruvate-ferredoxin oxidoreductase [Scenedesmus sp. NREL 46B-D3]|nr:pyruvate-ferredoxin oxidoreductase [Scenedesmus sp. NREL 46B-D3]